MYVRTSRAHCDPSECDQVLAGAERMNPSLSQLPGFRSSYWGVDRDKRGIYRREHLGYPRARQLLARRAAVRCWFRCVYHAGSRCCHGAARDLRGRRRNSLTKARPQPGKLAEQTRDRPGIVAVFDVRDEMSDRRAHWLEFAMALGGAGLLGWAVWLLGRQSKCRELFRRSDLSLTGALAVDARAKQGESA